MGTEVDGLAAGVELMLAGMGTVFVFLTALVVATTLMSALVQRYAPPPAAAAPAANQNRDVVAAISAAITMHRQRHSAAPSVGGEGPSSRSKHPGGSAP